MKNKLAALLIVAFVFTGISVCGYFAQAQRPETPKEKAEEPQTKARRWMRDKLAASQKILEGMTTADYELIAKNAQSMLVMGYLEGGDRADNPSYQEQRIAFVHANGAIILKARDKNLDGVTIAYAQLTISCVQCHKLVRDMASQ